MGIIVRGDKVFVIIDVGDTGYTYTHCINYSISTPDLPFQHRGAPTLSVVAAVEAKDSKPDQGKGAT